MALNIYDTYFMLAAIEKMKPEHQLFRTRYFPTNAAMDIFGTSHVLADYREDTQKRAPFVLPRVGGVPVTRDGFSTAMLEPANICVSIPLTLDQLTQRGFGESLLSQATPAERAQHLLIHDLETLNQMITRSEEMLAVNTILNNGTVMRHRTERADIYEDVGVQFYDGENNPALFTPASVWAHSTYADGTWTPGNWYADICAMVKDLTQNGRTVRELVVSEDVADFLMSDGWILAMLDNRRIEIGRIDPAELGEHAYQLGSFNFRGRILPIIVSIGTYEEDGVDTPYLPDGTVIAIAPNVGRGLYGAVTLMENETIRTVAGTRVPERIVNQRPASIETQVTSRPLFVPNRINPWRVATGVLT